MAKKYVYLFSEGNATMRELLGGKGANLAEMTKIGLPVPQGFTISTEACTQYYEDGRRINDDIQAQIMENIEKMEGITGKKFGDLKNPLLVSVRSGARASMPGMMDTILNLGLNEQVVNAIAEKSGNPRWAWDCYRRFIQMYSDVVMEVGKKYFEELIDEMKAKKGVSQDVDLTAEDLKELASQFKAEYKENPEIESKGFCEAVTIRDFPIRDKGVDLIVRRRKWYDKQNNRYFSDSYDLKAEETRYSKEFAAFLKGVYGDDSYDLPFA